MQGRYSPGIYLSLTDCTNPSKEEDFNKWYNEVHIPDCEALWFVRNSGRYKLVPLSEAPARSPKYLCLHEIWRDDMEYALREIRVHNQAAIRPKPGHVFKEMSTMISTLYQKTGPTFQTERSRNPIRGVHIVLYNCIDSTKEAAYNKWQNEQHVYDVLNAGLFHTCYRFRVVNPTEPGYKLPSYLHIYETDLEPRHALEGLLSHPPWPGGGVLGDVLLNMSFTRLFPK